MTARPRRTLIVTGPLGLLGGVASVARLAARHLAARGHDVTIAHYATLSADPGLSPPLGRLLAGGRPGVRHDRDDRDGALIAVGCRLPELEATYYADSPRWRAAIAAHDRHIAIGGTVVVAHPLRAAGVPHLAWCASDVAGDRADRRRAMGTARRLYEMLVVGPLLARLERRVLSGPGRMFGISDFSAAALAAAAPAGAGPVGVVPIPVDLDLFRPPASPPAAGVIGFAGRLSDPRKNVALLIDALAVLRPRGVAARLVLAGDRSEDLVRQAAARGLGDAVEFLGPVAPGDLPAFYRTLDVFAIPSRQEGHAIVGVEAAACGVPVVSTRCGGPECFVSHGVDGFLTGFDAGEMADRIDEIVANRALRAALSAKARLMAETRFAHAVFAGGFDEAWRTTWPEDRAGA